MKIEKIKEGVFRYKCSCGQELELHTDVDVTKTDLKKNQKEGSN